METDGSAPFSGRAKAAPTDTFPQVLRLWQVRLRYLLGELLLATWKPRLAVVSASGFEARSTPPSELDPALPRDADGFLLRHVDTECFPVGIGRYGNFISYVAHPDVLYYVEIRGTFSEYLRGLSTKSRQNLNRSVRRFLDKRPGLNRYEVYCTPSEIVDFHARAAAISGQTYQSRMLDSGLAATKEFLDEMIATAREGRARGYLLFDDEKAIAFAWCRHQDDRLVYDVVGYLPEYAECSPGTVLLYLILAEAHRLQLCKVFDFGPGEAHYKSMLATGCQHFVDVYLFRRTLRHWLLAYSHYRLENLSTRLGQMLEAIGAKKKVKALLRMLR